MEGLIHEITIVINRCFVLVCSIIAFGCSSSKKVIPDDATLGKKNIVIILADDLGRYDLATYGNDFIESPNLDALAREGIKFNNGYAAAPLCSPTRASILTGNNPARINLTEHLHGYGKPGPHQKLIPPRIVTGLPPSTITIPEALAANGYNTGHFGKWHLGKDSSSPAKSGFNTSYGGGEEGLPKSFFFPFFWGKPYPDLLLDTKEGDYLDDALTNKALSFMQLQNGKPFYLELNLYSPHVPIEGKEDLVQKYHEKRKRTGYKGLPEDEYAAMVENLDYNVGRVINYLKRTGLDKNTIVIFLSDNGGLNVEEVPAFAKHTPPTTNSPLLGGKGYIYEGGIKAPWIIWMPSLVKSGREDNTLVITDDIFNTCMQVAGVNKRSRDGVGLLPILVNKSISERSLYWNFPHYSPQHGKPGAVVRTGNFKLIEWYEDGKLELFDLKNDLGERMDLSKKFPEKVKAMKADLDEWRRTIGAKIPALNPDYIGEDQK